MPRTISLDSSRQNRWGTRLFGHRALYAAFDRVPGAKGAAIHIAHLARAIEQAWGDALLVCVADGIHSPVEREGNLEVLRLAGGARHLVDRINGWQRKLERLGVDGARITRWTTSPRVR